MTIETIKTVTVLGAGIMGHGIAQSFLIGGYPVILYDIQSTFLKTARAHIEKNLELFLQARLVTKQEIRFALERLTTNEDLQSAVAGSEFILEAAPESLTLKQELFQKVESFCQEGAIIASNTSSLTLKNIGVLVKNKKRIVITHWFNPPHIVPTVEVVRGGETSDDTMETTCQLLKRINKNPIRINVELPGFLINRIQTAMMREILDLYEKGVASAQDIDEAVKGSIGFRLSSIGPLLTVDLAGLDLILKSCENLLPHIQSSAEPPKSLRTLVSQGHYGIKTGKGFYDYPVDFSKPDLDQTIKERDRKLLNLLRIIQS